MAQYKITNDPYSVDFSLTNGNGLVRRTVQNAKNLLLCRMGEIPYDRSRGFNHGLFDLPQKELDEALLPELDRVMMWEPDVEVVSAKATRQTDGSTRLEVVIEVGIAE